MWYEYDDRPLCRGQDVDAFLELKCKLFFLLEGDPRKTTVAPWSAPVFCTRLSDASSAYNLEHGAW